jgi:hypothetical protein
MAKLGIQIEIYAQETPQIHLVLSSVDISKGKYSYSLYSARV